MGGREAVKAIREWVEVNDEDDDGLLCSFDDCYVINIEKLDDFLSSLTAEMDAEGTVELAPEKVARLMAIAEWAGEMAVNVKRCGDLDDKMRSNANDPKWEEWFAEVESIIEQRANLITRYDELKLPQKLSWPCVICGSSRVDCKEDFRCKLCESYVCKSCSTRHDGCSNCNTEIKSHAALRGEVKCLEEASLVSMTTFTDSQSFRIPNNLELDDGVVLCAGGGDDNYSEHIVMKKTDVTALREKIKRLEGNNGVINPLTKEDK